MKKTVLMSAAKKARIALAVMAVCGFTFAGAQSAFAAIEISGMSNTITDAKDSSTVIGTENKLKGGVIDGENTNFNVLESRNALTKALDSNGNLIYGDNINIESSYKNGNAIFGYNIKLSDYAYDSVVVGSDNELSGTGAHAVVVGKHNKAASYWGVTIGYESELGSMSSVVVGSLSKATGEDACVFGTKSKATGKYSVALGSNSTADEDNTVSVGGMHEVQIGNKPTGEAIMETQWLKRRITNVADGTKDTDAATVGQVITNIQKNGNTLEFYTGKGADGSGTKKWEFDLAASGGSTLTQDDFNNMLDASTKFNDLQTAVGNKANANGDNITTGEGSQWADKLGTGAIENGNNNLVNGGTVYNKIGDTSQLANANLGNNLSDAVITVNTKAETALNKATDNEKKIGDTSQLANANLGNNLSDAVVKVNDKVGDISKLTTANLGNNLSDAVVKVDEKTKQNAKDIEKVNGRVDELGGRVDTLGGAVSKLDTKVNKVGAGAAALAALHPMDFDSDNKLTFAAGVGSYHGASAAAIGAFYRPSEQVMFSISGNMGNGENMVNAGVSFALDRPSKTPTTKAALVKTVAAQNEQIAALSETVAEQNEKIARLEAMVEKLAAKQNA